MHTDLLPHHHGGEEHHNIDQIRAQLAKADNFQIVADIFKQVGDPTRVRIFWLLCHCEECVQNISALMEMSSPAVSHHLRGLRKPRQVRYFYSVQYSPAVLMTGSAASSMFAASRRVSGAS